MQEHSAKIRIARRNGTQVVVVANDDVDDLYRYLLVKFSFLSQTLHRISRWLIPFWRFPICFEPLHCRQTLS